MDALAGKAGGIVYWLSTGIVRNTSVREAPPGFHGGLMTEIARTPRRAKYIRVVSFPPAMAGEKRPGSAARNIAVRIKPPFKEEKSRNAWHHACKSCCTRQASGKVSSSMAASASKASGTPVASPSAPNSTGATAPPPMLPV